MNDLKDTGITKRVDELGRIVLPKSIRKKLSIAEQDTLRVFYTDEGIFLKKEPAVTAEGLFKRIDAQVIASLDLLEDNDKGLFMDHMLALEEEIRQLHNDQS